MRNTATGAVRADRSECSEPFGTPYSAISASSPTTASRPIVLKNSANRFSSATFRLGQAAAHTNGSRDRALVNHCCLGSGPARPHLTFSTQYAHLRSDEVGQLFGKLLQEPRVLRPLNLDRQSDVVLGDARLGRAARQPIQKMTCRRMPRLYATFNLHSGELVEVQRIDVGKPAPGKIIATVSIWVRPKN